MLQRGWFAPHVHELKQLTQKSTRVRCGTKGLCTTIISLPQIRYFYEETKYAEGYTFISRAAERSRNLRFSAPHRHFSGAENRLLFSPS
jgi:hypothetical protein